MKLFKRDSWDLLAAVVLATLVAGPAQAANGTMKHGYLEGTATTGGITLTVVANVAGGDAAAFNADHITVCNDSSSIAAYFSPLGTMPTGASDGYKVGTSQCIELAFDKTGVDPASKNSVGFTTVKVITLSSTAAVRLYSTRR